MAKFTAMSDNEWLGDPTTHMMKTGATLRSPANADQEALSRFIPRMANGVKVEYDIYYSSPEGRIAGYKYTDFLTKAIMITPCNLRLAIDNIAEVAKRPPLESGYNVINELVKTIDDKYILTRPDEYADVEEIVVLPGTNLLSKDAVDVDKIDAMVKDTSRKVFVKIHPITAKVWETMLKNRWGDRVIPSDAPLYPIIRAAKKVHFTMSSETGLAAAILGKKIGVIDHPEYKRQRNFENIYRGLDKAVGHGTIRDRLVALLTYPESGLLTVYHEKPEERIKAYFNHMSKHQHV